MGKQEEEGDRQVGWGVRQCIESSPATAGPFPFTPLIIRCPFMALPVVEGAGERQPVTQSRGLCCIAHRVMGGEVGGREAGEERNYELSAQKVQVLLTATAGAGISCASMF